MRDLSIYALAAAVALLAFTRIGAGPTYAFAVNPEGTVYVQDMRSGEIWQGIKAASLAVYGNPADANETFKKLNFKP